MLNLFSLTDQAVLEFYRNPQKPIEHGIQLYIILCMLYITMNVNRMYFE